MSLITAIPASACTCYRRAGHEFDAQGTEMAVQSLKPIAAPTAPEHPPLEPSIPIVLYADEWGGVGGTAGYVIMLGRGLRRRGHRVAAICYPNDEVAGMRAALEAAGVDVRPIAGGSGGSVRGLLARHRAYAALFREYRGAVLALMMGYHTRGGGVILAGALTGAGAIVRADLTPPEPPFTRRQGIALRLKDRLTDRVVVGAIENREAFARTLGRRASRVDVIHTGIELEHFRPGEGRDEARSELGFGPDDLVVGTVSRLDDERKGNRYFVEMAAHIASTLPRAQFLIVGRGVLQQELEAQARTLGVRDRIVFAGWRPDVARMLAAMDVFVMPSLFEGGPTTVLEAMAMAKPSVASNVGMVPEVMEHGRTGLIVAPGDSTALADEVTTLLTNIDLCSDIGEQARKKALADFSIDRMVDRYLAVFARAMAWGPRRRRARAWLPVKA
jgi:glycosyltransferase involved in cell wall biosynthesis